MGADDAAGADDEGAMGADDAAGALAEGFALVVALAVPDLPRLALVLGAPLHEDGELSQPVVLATPTVPTTNPPMANAVIMIPGTSFRIEGSPLARALTRGASSEKVPQPRAHDGGFATY